MNKVLITAKVHSYLIDYLTQHGFKVTYQPGISYEEVHQQIHGCVGLVITTRIQVDRNILDNAVNLQWIARLGSGMEQIDVEYAHTKGIQCVSSPEGNCDAVGEHALGMLLCLFNNILRSHYQLRKGVWEREMNRGHELNGKTVGIIGYGHTGSAFARKLQGFDVEILAFDKYKQGFGNAYVREVSMSEIFKHADIVSLHVPLTSETRHLANQSFFEAFTGAIYLINTSRGPVVHTADLIRQLEEGKVLGACLDVLENEDLDSYDEQDMQQFQYLVSSDRVILTPHIAGYSHEASFKMADVVLKKLGI